MKTFYDSKYYLLSMRSTLEVIPLLTLLPRPTAIQIPTWGFMKLVLNLDWFFLNFHIGWAS